MKKLFLAFLVVFSFPALLQATPVQCGTTAEVSSPNRFEFVENCRIILDNQAGGEIKVSTDKGLTFKKIGTVLVPAQKVNTQGYTASKWVENGEVAATAVNAIHIKVGDNVKADRGIIFSLLPKEFLKSPDNYRSFYSASSSVITSLAAGDGIFGGKYSPLVGNQLEVLNRRAVNFNSTLEVFAPKEGDRYQIVVKQPKDMPLAIVFENRFGGLIVARYLNQGEKIIGQVLKPVLGIGRFEGTKYAGVGRIRANHAAVIDVSTSPLGKIGGFQIIPSYHGMDAEMIYARAKTQWMVVGPPGLTEAAIEGAPPLFKYFIRPVYVESSLREPDWDTILLSKYLVEVKLAGEDNFRPMPAFELAADEAVPTWAERALANVTHFRILFPQN
jgi:hypothetical protein